MKCKAKTTKGKPCGKHAIAGARVCRVHGGAAPQVKDAAKLRILAAADPAAARLIQIAMGRKTKHSDAILAIRELLNRAGVVASGIQSMVPGDDSAQGQILWEEFIQIHRKQVPPEG